MWLRHRPWPQCDPVGADVADITAMERTPADHRLRGRPVSPGGRRCVPAVAKSSAVTSPTDKTPQLAVPADEFQHPYRYKSRTQPIHPGRRGKRVAPLRLRLGQLPDHALVAQKREQWLKTLGARNLSPSPSPIAQRHSPGRVPGCHDEHVTSVGRLVTFADVDDDIADVGRIPLSARQVSTCFP